MKQFELRFLDTLDVVVWTRSYLAGDDLAALAKLERLSTNYIVEVWDGPRKVARVKQGNVLSASTDKLCG